jgi:Peptidase family M23
MKSMAGVLMATVSVLVSLSPAMAQNRCSNTPDYFAPVTSGDGQRYPLEIGPLVWHLLGSGVYPVKGSDGRTHLAFAMQFTNVWNQPTTIQSVEVVNPATDNKPTGKNHVISAKDEDVTGMVKLSALPSSAGRESYAKELKGSQSGVMFFDVAYGDGNDVPCAISLRVHSSQPENTHLPESTVVSAPLKVSQQQAIVLSPPFKGDGWLDANGCCAEVGPHRFVTNSVNGTLQPSEQFAIDWIKVDAQGKAFRTDGKKPEDWLCYGVELLAVADGTVVEAMRDLADVPPGKQPEGLTFGQIGGNRVVLDLGGGRYAMYAHMAPQSLTVHVGDHVKAGQKIGLLGNTGNTTGPHLHFQISDQPSLLDATSLPFVFESMKLEGRTSANLDDMDTLTIAGTPLPMETKTAKKLTRMMPLSRDILTF